MRIRSATQAHTLYTIIVVVTFSSSRKWYRHAWKQWKVQQVTKLQGSHARTALMVAYKIARKGNCTRICLLQQTANLISISCIATGFIDVVHEARSWPRDQFLWLWPLDLWPCPRPWPSLTVQALAVTAALNFGITLKLKKL